MSAPSVGIVGGGILGLTSAYRLLQKGVRVALYERSPDLGGLVGSFDLDGTPADRFYHVILPTDDRVLGLAHELGLDEAVHFRPAGNGFWDGQRLVSMNSLSEFLRFPVLRPHERLRLATFVLRCQLEKHPERLDDVPLEDWLRRLSGRRTVERLWRPLLDSKFDGRFDDLPATYLWARTRRMAGTRDSAGREVLGSIAGGYQRLVDLLTRKIVELGGEVHAGTAVDRIASSGPRCAGIVVDGRLRQFDSVLCTLTPPQAGRLLSAGLAVAAPPDPCRYLGVVCVVLRLPRSLSPYYSLSILDRSVSLTTVVETTHVVDPVAAGGTLVYAAKYVEPDHADLDRPVDEVRDDYIGQVRQIFPALEASDVLAASVQRARIVEPVHPIGGAKRVPEMFSIPGLALASTAHVYPDIVNGQSVIGVADRAVEGILARLPIERRAAA